MVYASHLHYSKIWLTIPLSSDQISISIAAYGAKILSARIPDAHRLLAERGLKVTPIRVRVFALLLTTPGVWLSHLQIWDSLNNAKKVNKVTVYRVLDWLLLHGMVGRVVTGARLSCFGVHEQVASAPYRSHFECRHCSNVTDLSPLEMESSQLALPAGFTSVEIELTIKGICRDCAQDQAPKSCPPTTEEHR